MKEVVSIAFVVAFTLMPIPDVSWVQGRDGSADLSGVDGQSLAVVRMPLDSTDVVYRGLNQLKVVFEFYQRRSGVTCWTGTEGMSVLGDSLVNTIANIRYYGLLPRQYHFDEIEQLLSTSNHPSLRSEALLTDALLLIARDLRWGRTRYPASPDSVAFRVLELVANGSNLNRTLQGLEPEDNGYRLLKAALKSSLDSLTGAEKVDWMRGHTFNSIPLHRTMQTVEVNLERWRSTRGPTNTLHVFVNLPAFTLDVLDGTASLLTSRVIVGTPETPTPLLKSMIECIVVYPYWHVPRKIAVDEYLPRIQKDPTFLESHHFDILDRSGAVVNADSIDWQSFTKDYFPVVMRQREGPENSLGLIKFVFDNPYAVYLHDTNARSLFRTDRRAYSHGCVRVEKAAELAHLLLSRERQSKSDAIEGAMQAKQRLSIELPQPVPIIIGYYTCEVRNGKFHQYPDIYRLDELLINDMYSE